MGIIPKFPQRFHPERGTGLLLVVLVLLLLLVSSVGIEVVQVNPLSEPQIQGWGIFIYFCFSSHPSNSHVGMVLGSSWL